MSEVYQGPVEVVFVDEKVGPRGPFKIWKIKVQGKYIPMGFLKGEVPVSRGDNVVVEVTNNSKGYPQGKIMSSSPATATATAMPTNRSMSPSKEMSIIRQSCLKAAVALTAEWPSGDETDMPAAGRLKEQAEATLFIAEMFVQYSMNGLPDKFKEPEKEGPSAKEWAEKQMTTED